jgi:hypothetical protein
MGADGMVDRLAFLVAIWRFPDMGAVEPLSLWFESYVRMEEFVRRFTSGPLMWFLGAVRWEFMQRVYVALHVTLLGFISCRLRVGSESKLSIKIDKLD